MINHLHYLTHRPEKGWDPVPEAHARRYSDEEAAFTEPRAALVSEVEARLGPVAGKALLDLGAGPGYYTAEFARRGARVTWLDVSATYAAIARAHCEKRQVEAEFIVSYIDDVARHGRTFDLIFSRLCWNYANSEPALARAIVDVLAPGGAAYVETATSAWAPGSSLSSRARSLLNDRLGLKIGHPFPPPGRTAQLFRRDRRVSVEVLPGRRDHDHLLVRRLT